MLLEVKSLSVQYPVPSGTIKAVDKVSFSLEKNEVLGIVGESGCGKSTVAFSLVRLLRPPGMITNGEIWFSNGNLTKDIVKISEKEMNQLRGRHISMVFQDPMTYLNPTMKIGLQIAESVSLHLGLSKREALARTQDVLEKVGLPSPSTLINYYPHQLSGGMKQRVLIAMAISCSPELVIADEPTTALDVIAQFQIIELLNRLTEEENLSLILISHDLGLVASICDRICVMYAGQIVEEGPVIDMYNNPLHPYTQGLLKSALSFEQSSERLYSIGGTVPSLINPPSGCRFHPRCPYAMKKCAEEEPPLKQVNDRRVKCWLY